MGGGAEAQAVQLKRDSLPLPLPPCLPPLAARRLAQKGPAVQRPLEPGEGPAVLEAYEHPRVKEARLQAQQVAAQVDAQQIAALAMQPPPERNLVSYEDL